MPLLFKINDFSGGLNNRFRQNRIQDNQLATIRNARWARFGALSKRLGTSRNVVQVAAANIGVIQSLFSYQFSNMSDEQLLIGDDEGRIVRSTSIGTYANLITGLSTSNDYEPNFAAFQGSSQSKVYLTNGVDAVRSIQGDNTVASVTDAIRARWITSHKGYLFLFNDVVSPDFSMLQWSNVFDGDVYDGINKESVNPGDGGYGTGMISYGDELILFKGPFYSNMSYGGSSMYRVLGDIFDGSKFLTYLEKIPLPTNVGVVHGRTAQILNGVLYFATNDGVYAYLGGGKAPELVSEIIRGEVNNWEKNDVHVSTRRAAATVWENKYILSLYNDGDSADLFNNRIYVLEDGKWWVDILSEGNDDFQAGSSTGMSWSPFRGDLYSGSAFTNVLRRWYTAAAFSDTMDAGTAENVNFSALTKEFDLESEVFFSHAYVHLRRQSSGTLTFEYNVDQRGAQSNSLDMSAADSEDTANSSSNILKKRVNINRKGRTIQFRMYDRGANDAEIYGIEVFGEKSRLNE